jgi:hypothetical protein
MFFYRIIVVLETSISEICRDSEPLTEVIRKDTQFEWESQQQAAFEKLKEKLCSDKVSAYTGSNPQFILTTEASKVAVGSILSQVQDGVQRPISYASCQMNRAEQTYSASKPEMLAVT